VQFDDLSFWQRQRGGKNLTAFAFDPKLLRSAIFECSPPTLFGQVHGPALEAADNVKVLLDANALELLPGSATRASHGRKTIGGVSVRKTQGGNFTVTGRAYVVAAGAMESARLLLLSDKVHPAGAGQ